MKRTIIFIVILLALLFPLVVTAQEGDDLPDNGLSYPPGTTLNDLNWCNAGQPWEKQCREAAAGTLDWDVDWLWECGWYMAHWSLGVNATVPLRCGGGDTDGDGLANAIDPCPDDPANSCAAAAEGICYDDAIYSDQYYTGPINTPGNAYWVTSTDGSCTGDPSDLPQMWVDTQFTTQREVVDYCNTIGSGYYYATKLDRYIIDPPVPPTYWTCYPLD